MCPPLISSTTIRICSVVYALMIDALHAIRDWLWLGPLVPETLLECSIYLSNTVEVAVVCTPSPQRAARAFGEHRIASTPTEAGSDCGESGSCPSRSCVEADTLCATTYNYHIDTAVGARCVYGFRWNTVWATGRRCGVRV